MADVFGKILIHKSIERQDFSMFFHIVHNAVLFLCYIKVYSNIHTAYKTCVYARVVRNLMAFPATERVAWGTRYTEYRWIELPFLYVSDELHSLRNRID